MTDDTVNGSASYFLSIEKTCGKPAAHWFTRLDDVADRKRMAHVALLKTLHGIGLGHANALVAFHRARVQD